MIKRSKAKNEKKKTKKETKRRVNEGKVVGRKKK